MSGILQTLANLGVLVFVVSSMLAMGLSLTLAQILASLRDTGFVLRALAANFLVVPAAALLILRIIPLDEPLGTGLMLLATAAGAPFLPKLAQAAKGSVALAGELGRRNAANGASGDETGQQPERDRAAAGA